MIKEESDGKEDSDHSLNSEVKETDTGSESRIPKNKGLAHLFFFFSVHGLSCFVYYV